MAASRNLPTTRAISDAVHGQIAVTPLEMDVIDSSCFQRLRNVRQLGLANLVYPSADYSRFSHSLGAMNAMGELMTALHHKHDELVTSTVVQVFRLVALLHDVGHYPLSHLYEDAIIAHTGLGRDETFNHERAGAHIIERRLNSILESSSLAQDFQGEIEALGRTPVELSHFIADVIRHERSISMLYGVYGVLDKLLSGAVDCDRLDYLLRTSTGSSLPYGVVDLDYLVHNVRLQEDPLNVVFSKKAQHAAAHMLESRVYDYLTTSYHKTVKSLELELIESILAAFKESELPFDEKKLSELASSSDWDAFDDGYVRSILLKSKSTTAKDVAARVFGRSPRKTLYTRTLELSKRRWDALSGYKTFKPTFRRLLERSSPPGVPSGKWFVQTVEALDASDASTFAEIDRANVLDNSELDVLSQVSKLRDRVTLVLHYYLDSGNAPDDGYKSKYEQALDEHVAQCLKEAGDEVAKLAEGEGA